MNIKKSNHLGMSTIDLMVVSVICILGGSSIYWAVDKFGFKQAGKYMGMVFAAQMLLIFISTRGYKKDLKKSYLKGHIEKQHYIDQVGKRFFKKHHPDEKID